MSKREFYLPLSGFIMSAVLLSSLSSFVIFIGYFSKLTNTNTSLLFYLGTLLYFAGMPAGKLIGRILKYHKNTILATFIVVTVISATVVFMPYVNNFALLLAFRFIQGGATILMEIFSLSYAYIYSDRKRILASTVSISGIPAGVAIGSSVPFLASMNPDLVYAVLGLLSFILIIPFVFLLSKDREALNVLKEEKKGTTVKMSITWLLAFLWMSIAGFNLVLGSILPIYLGKYDPKDIVMTMNIFGFWGAGATIVGGLIAYFLYSKALGYRALIYVSIIGYLFAVPGFILLALRVTNLILYLAMFLTQFEAFVIAAIYTLPKKLYPPGLVAKGTWEFSFVGSLGHIIAPLILIPIAYSIGFNYMFAIILIFPIYGIFAMGYLLTKINNKI
ncbi:MAG: MFS transporter [Thermoplasmata archaeon]